MKKKSIAKIIKEDQKIQNHIQRTYLVLTKEDKQKINDKRLGKYKFNL